MNTIQFEDTTPKFVWVQSTLFQLESMPPANNGAYPRIHKKQHNPYKRLASFALCIDPHILVIQGQIKEVYRIIEQCPLNGTRKYLFWLAIF